MKSKLIKYPRTPHLPWSEGRSKDDRIMTYDTLYEHLTHLDVVVTVKMDGENTTMYRDHIHARSLDSKSRPDQSYVRGLHASIAHQLPQDMRICGENLFAKHSITYHNLYSYFQVFGIWHKDLCIPWLNTKDWCTMLGLETVQVIYTGPFNEKRIKNIWENKYSNTQCEGYVVRPQNSFTAKLFSSVVAKFVRKNHVQTDKHWLHGPIVPNKLTN